jgi:hypothetical protein
LTVHDIPTGGALTEIRLEGWPATLHWAQKTGKIWAATGDARYYQLKLERQGVT